MEVFKICHSTYTPIITCKIVHAKRNFVAGSPRFRGLEIPSYSSTGNATRKEKDLKPVQGDISCLLGNVTLHDVKVCHLKIRNKLERYMTNLENRERKAKHAPHNSLSRIFCRGRKTRKRNQIKGTWTSGRKACATFHRPWRCL